jgi:alpha-ketoglutarate-dependent sulfate ester dioxygenase
MSNATGTSTRIDITPLAGEIGAVISGVDAAAPPDDETIAQVRRALLAHKVIFLRDQRHSPAKRPPTTPARHKASPVSTHSRNEGVPAP